MTIRNILTILQIVSIIGGIGWAIHLFLVSQKIQKAQLYKDLEFKSIDVILRQVDKPELLKIYDPEFDVGKDAQIKIPISAYGYAILNLFELMFNLQKRKMLPEEIFLTWIEWFWEFSRGKFAAQLWAQDAVPHYSSEFSELMNKMVHLVPTQQEEAYKHAMKLGLISQAELSKWRHSNLPYQS